MSAEWDTLEKVIAARYRDAHKAGQWTEDDWGEYRDRYLGRNSPVHVMNWRQRMEVRRAYTGPSCVAHFLRMALGTYQGSKTRKWDGSQRYPSRSNIRYMAFSGDWCARPKRAALGRWLERLHWLADLGPPTWEQVRSREKCVKSIEVFRSNAGHYTMANGCSFQDALWTSGSVARAGGYTRVPLCVPCANRAREYERQDFLDAAAVAGGGEPVTQPHREVLCHYRHRTKGEEE
jgi:hypothetical protein